MSIHLVESSEEERILSFFNLIDEEFFPPLSARVKLDEYSSKLSGKAVNFFLVSDAVDVGHVAFYCNNSVLKVAFISSVAVHPGFQGRGFAKILLDGALMRCREMGMDTVQLEVNEKNSKALRFYGKNGFSRVKEGLMERPLV